MGNEPKAPIYDSPSGASRQSASPSEAGTGLNDETLDALLEESSLGSAAAHSLRKRTTFSEVARMYERAGREDAAGTAWKAAVAAAEPDAVGELARWTREREGLEPTRVDDNDTHDVEQPGTRRQRRARGRIQEGPRSVLGNSEAADLALRRHHQRQGPWDAEDAPRDGRLRLDLSSVQIPVPRGARLVLEPDPSGPLRAVHAVVPEGRLTVSAFAAPRTGGLWPELVEELADQLAHEGASIRRDRGEWGREIVARNDEVVARVVGVDGPRWMLRGVGTGPAESALKLHGMLREMIRGTIVVRSNEPMPVRSLLPLEIPDEVPEPFAESLIQHLPTRPRDIVGPRPLRVPPVLPEGEKVTVSPGIVGEGDLPTYRSKRTH